MKKSIFICVLSISFLGFSQTKRSDLEIANLHKNVQKTINHYYKYDKESGGFVKSSVSIKRYNNEGNLAETYYSYESQYSETNPIKKLYNYNKNGFLTSVENISDNIGKYSVNTTYVYNKKGHLIKTNYTYKDGSSFYTSYINDKKGNVTNKKEYSKDNKLTSETNTAYKGNKRIENRTSYSSKDGSIIGTYITTYQDDLNTKYQSSTKYENSTSTYQYDKQKNVLSSFTKGKNNSSTSYNYVYDKKGNWIKKHFRSGKYQYFYFREIYFKNGDVIGGSQFDRIFINKHGNFDNVNVVALKKKPKKEEMTTIVDNTMPAFTSKNWTFNTVKIGEKNSALNGTTTLSVTNDNKMQIGAKVYINMAYKDQESPLDLTVVNYSNREKSHFWTFEDTAKEKVYLSLFKEKIGKIDAVLTIGEGDNKLMVFLN